MSFAIKEFQMETSIKMEAEEKYLHALVGKIFKLLPIREEGDAFLAYAQGLQRELSGCESILPRVAFDHDWASILAVLANIIDGGDTFAKFRRDVFRMISLCETLISRHFYGGIDDE